MYNNFKDLYNEVIKCKKCELCRERKTVVFGEGNIHADIMFIGEGPGQREDETARPFVGPAGQLLNKMLSEIGLKREDVYIANIVKCRPPKNRDPKEEEQNACMPYLRNQLALIRPKVIICLGRIAASVILKREVKMTKEHGIWTESKGFYIMPTFHPAALLHNEGNIPYAIEDFKLIKEKVAEMSIC